MRRRSFLALLPAAAATRAFSADANPPDDALLRAMRAELERSGALQLGSLEKPYFIEYTAVQHSGFTVTASLGSIINSSQSYQRSPGVRIRVGDPSFDNSNYVYSERDTGSRYDSPLLPVEDDIECIRRTYWLASDREYKTAVEAIGRKRAALKNLTLTDKTPDFWSAPAVDMVLPYKRMTFDTERWTKLVAEWSVAFRDYPDLVATSVQFALNDGVRYLLNTEGTRLRTPESLAIIQMRAQAYAPDGSVVRDSISLQADSTSELPKPDEVKGLVKQLAESVQTLAKAEYGEAYAGPVLFEGMAGAQLIAEVLGRELSVPRRPVSEPGRPVPFRASELEGRIGGRVLPDFMDVVDDPTRTEWEGVRLMGQYPVDEEGVVPKPLALVEKGVLKAVLLSRQPVRDFTASNGRARLPGPFGARTATYSNLIVSASESVSAADLRKKFLEMCAARNKPYGIIVRRMDYPTSASADELRRIAMNMQQSGGGRVVSLPLVTYRVYPDGREEPVRGLQFRGLGVRALRDITAVSRERYGFHFLNSLAPFAMLGAGGYVSPSSVIAPVLLLEDAELDRPREDQQKLPVVAPPPLS